MADDVETVEVYRASGLPEAQALRLLLEQNGITVHVDNELLQGAVGELPMGWATAPRIMVRKADELAARALVQAYVGRGEPRSGASLDCLACGAKMSDHDTCPACGWTYADGAASEDEPQGEDPPDEPAFDAPSPAVDRAVWWEVGAVLAVGVLPHIVASISYLARPVPPGGSYWLDALVYVVSSACTVYVALYLMHRSGEPWKSFGLGRPRASDLIFGSS